MLYRSQFSTDYARHTLFRLLMNQIIILMCFPAYRARCYPLRILVSPSQRQPLYLVILVLLHSTPIYLNNLSIYFFRYIEYIDIFLPIYRTYQYTLDNIPIYPFRFAYPCRPLVNFSLPTSHPADIRSLPGYFQVVIDRIRLVCTFLTAK